MKIFRAALAALFILAAPAFAYAQGAPSTRALVVQTCGLQTFPLLQGGQPAYAPFTILQNGNLCSSGGPGGSTTDPNNAPYGSPTATPGTTITPGGSSVTAGRAIKISCPSSTPSPGPNAAPVAGQGYAILTLANSPTPQTVRQPLANGGDYGIQVLQVTQVGSQVTESGTLATCVFQNVN